MTVQHSDQFERVGGAGKFMHSAREACEAVQVDPTRLPRNNGRFDTVGKHGKGDAAVKYHADGKGGCVFNHQTRQCAVWREESTHPVSKDEWRRMRLAEAERRAEEERREESRAQYAAETAYMILRSSAPISTHPYLEKKRVRPLRQMYAIDADDASDIFVERGYRNNEGNQYRLGLHGHLLVIPMYRGRRLQTLEFIDAEGQKRFMKDGPTAGCYWMTHGSHSYQNAFTVGVAEGVATALSVAMVDGIPCVAAMSCGNLLSVARRISAANPSCEIVILSDIGNGQLDAESAAINVNGKLAVPPFTPELMDRFSKIVGGGRPSDWNDYYIAKGYL